MKTIIFTDEQLQMISQALVDATISNNTPSFSNRPFLITIIDEIEKHLKEVFEEKMTHYDDGLTDSYELDGETITCSIKKIGKGYHLSTSTGHSSCHSSLHGAKHLLNIIKNI